MEVGGGGEGGREGRHEMCCLESIGCMKTDVVKKRLEGDNQQ